MNEEKNNTSKFTGKAAIYSKYRSNYPNECIQDIVKEVSADKNIMIADIGAGTGKLTKQFLEKGIKVIAVEPNKDMLEVAIKDLSKYNELFEYKQEPAENTSIKSNSIDIITVAQAFHWFDKDKFKSECKRILKPNGIIAIMWNFIDYKQELESKIIETHKQYTSLTFNASEEEQRDNDIINFFGEDNYKFKIYKNNYIEDKEQFLGRQLSMSYALNENDDKYDEYVAEFNKLFAKYSKDGVIEVHNNTYCYVGRIF